jgi:N-methylhydantoinase A
MTYTVAIDIGGTCTDCVAVDEAGSVVVAKTFSTPQDFSIGIINGLEQLASAVGVSLDGLLASTSVFLHSTTVAENAIVDGTMATAGLITTRGFEDTLAAMRGGYGRWSGLTELEKRDPINTNKPPELIPRRLVQGVDGRRDAHGDRISPVDESQIVNAVRSLVEEGVESLAVCLLWSFLSPDDERRIETVAKEIDPRVFVCCSHGVAPTIGEYERMSTTALNARLAPVVSRYLETLHQRLIERGFGGALLVMQAYGGLLSVSDASARPVGMIESGPVGGVIGSRVVGEWLGARNVIAADMGGTTFKVGVIRDGLIDYERESIVFRYHFAAPKLDIASLGLAGGSIIWIDRASCSPQLGPQSAGSFPGPVCYGNGGTEPTISDVDALLGYLHPAYFLGGGRELQVDAAREAFADKIADPLQLPTEEAASEIYRLANSHIADMLHRTTVQRGLDPRGFTLVSIGGTAGMHVMSYAARLGVQRVVVPSTASVHSATGLLHSDIVYDEQATKPMVLPVEPEAVQETFDDLRGQVLTQFEREGFGSDDIEIMRSIDMRYARQTNIVTVPVEGGGQAFDRPLLGKTVDKFEELYRERYGSESGFRDAGIELVTFRMRGIALIQNPRPAKQEVSSVDPRGALVERRRAWVDDLGVYEDIDGFSWDLLRAGNVIQGPAIVWSSITTVVLRSIDRAEMDEQGNLVLISSSR